MLEPEITKEDVADQLLWELRSTLINLNDNLTHIRRTPNTMKDLMDIQGVLFSIMRAIAIGMCHGNDN